MTGQQQTEQGAAFDRWSRNHEYEYRDRQGARLWAGRGSMQPTAEQTEVYFAMKPGSGGHLVFLSLAEVEQLRDRLTEILDHTRGHPAPTCAWPRLHRFLSFGLRGRP